MADKTGIGWTEATRIVDRGGRRVRLYQRKRLDGPGAQERRLKAVDGLRWCRGCSAWLPAVDVTRQGNCRPHEAEAARSRYASDENYRERRRAHAARRKRGADRVPDDAGAMLRELFDHECAYCPEPATTNDHAVAVILGGQTRAGNIVPCCKRCNSSKRAAPIEAWFDRAPMVKPFTIEYLTTMGVL